MFELKRVIMLRLMSRNWAQAIALLWMGITAIIVLARHIILLPIRTSLNYNEGWNAYQAAHAFGFEPLYPGLKAAITNNYPPASFYIVGALGKILGDNIIAGRVISLFAFIFIGAGIGWIVAKRFSQPVLGLFISLFFLATFGYYFSDYIAMNDPQMLAHAVQIAALVWLLYAHAQKSGSQKNRSQNERKSFLVPTVGIALLIAFSLLIKHNLLALPAAIALWLFFYKKRSCFLFVAIVTGVVIVSFFLFNVIYGPNFLIGLLEAPRIYGLKDGLLKIEQWLAPQGWLISLGAFAIITQWRDADVQLLGLFAGFALCWGTAIAGGAGVNYNAVFDVTIALCLLSGWALGRLGGTLEGALGKALSARRRYPWRFSRSQAFVAIALSLVLFFTLPTQLGALLTVGPKTESLAARSAEDIAIIASFKGEVVCEALAMCYFAGKPAVIDVFNFGQKLRLGLVSEADWIKRFEDQEFSLLYLESLSDRLPESSYRAVETYYEPFRRSTFRGHDYVFWRRRIT